MTIAGQLNESQVAQNEQAAQTLGNAGTKVISSNTFTYFVAFDGTNNDKDNLSLTGRAYTPPDPQQTNAAQLYTQVRDANEGNRNVVVDYIRGVGTNGTFDMSAAFADDRVEANAQDAYAKFAIAANDWLNDNPGGSITTAITAFSRGGPTGIRFAQILNERGLTLSDGTVLKVSVSAMALIDPVGTTVADSKSIIPSNVDRDNFIVVGANNEYRSAFLLENYNAGESNIDFFGNHCDVGGCFGGGGIGELVLGGTDGTGGLTGFFRNVGVSITNAPSTRLYSAVAPQYVHDNSRDSYGNEIWSTHGTFNPDGTSPQRLLDDIPSTGQTPSISTEPAYDMTLAGDVLSAESAARQLLNVGQISTDWYHDFTSWTTEFWLTSTPTSPLPLYNPGWGPGSNPWDIPIGAFYESRTPATDTSVTPDGIDLAEAVPDSNYRTLRDTNDFYMLYTGQYFWWNDGDIKINFGLSSTLIGTDGNDSFDAASYEHGFTNVGQGWYFNFNLLTNFLGGDGNDTVGGSSHNDAIWGGTGNDWLLGYAGDDKLYGEDGGDYLVGEIGNDLLYGGDGDDYLAGLDGACPGQQRSLNAGETDNDKLYGGAGNDSLRGGSGNDYLDGGLGADIMYGDTGDDTYIVNSVNDYILELAGEGYDVVVSSANYQLGSAVEELRLLAGMKVNGTGNALDNNIVGNNRDNILDGVTGADTMIGGDGDDIYYVDNVGDQSIEVVGEGFDTVQSNITHTLDANIENLVLLDFAKPEKGLADGQAIVVYGYPKRNELDYLQGDAMPDYQGTCALTSIANLLTQVNVTASERDIVQRAIDNGWAETDPAVSAYKRGGSSFTNQRHILDSYGIRNGLLQGYNEAGMANLLRSGRGVILGLNAGVLWDDARYADGGVVNHTVTVTGVAYRENDDALLGFYIVDSGRGLVSDMTRFVGIDQFRLAANVPNAYAIYTLEPLKVWDENINGYGNELDNVVAGNRGNNLLSGGGGDDMLTGGEGNDILVGGAGTDLVSGGAGNDIYKFVRGDGADTIVDTSGVDRLVLDEGILTSDVTVSRVGSQIKIAVSAEDSVVFTEGIPGQGGVESVLFADGTAWQMANLRQMLNSSPVGDVVVSGMVTQNKTLMVGNTLSDADGVGTIGYQWQSSADAVTWNDIGGATESTYTLTAAEAGKQVRVVASYVDGFGTVESVASVNEAPTGELAASGTAEQNQTLTIINSLADLDGLGAFAYQWQSSTDGIAWNDIGGATGNTFALTEAEVNKQVRVGACYVDGHGMLESVAGTATGVIANVNDAPAGGALIGIATQNQILTISALSDLDGLGAVAYQWQSSTDGITWNSIVGATGNAFTLTEAQVGRQVRSVASYVDGHGTFESVVSVATSPVINVNDAPTGIVSVSGIPTWDQTLTAHNGLADIDGLGTIQYQWQSSSNGSAWNSIDGATGDTFTVTGPEVGQKVRAVATYTDGHGTVESVGSAATSVVGVVLMGTDGADVLLGTPGVDIGDGLGGKDWLDGGAEADYLYGGTGSDFYVVDNVGDLVIEYANEGTDSVRSSVSYGLSANVENLTLTANAAINGTGNDLANRLIGNNAANMLDGGIGADFMQGRLGNDTYVVDSVGDVVIENVGEGTDTVLSSISYVLSVNVENLTLTGSAAINGSGNDLANILIGNSATNILTGGLGNDRYVVDNAADVVVENAGEGTDTVQSTISYVLSATVENLILAGTAAINGTGTATDNVLTGNSAGNTLEGGAGNDSLNGGAGADTMIGGLGDDTFTLDSIGDVMLEVAGEGIDTVQASLDNWILSANLENLVLTGTIAKVGTGNALNNIITGNWNSNTLNGGEGADTMIGGNGDDTYTVDNIGDIVVENVDQGIDEVRSSATYTLSANVENLTLTGTALVNGTGNAGDNVLRGNSAGNTLVGGAGNDDLKGDAGADTMVGGQGDDTFTVDSIGDMVLEIAGEGIDHVKSSVSYTLSADVENLTLSTTRSINGTGNGLANTIVGNSAANILDGGAGSDTLEGGGGVDTLKGGLGDDIYIVSGTSAAVLESLNEGTDTVQSSVSYTLGANVENLTLTGNVFINGTGNTLNNSIVGNAQFNTLNGGAGDDTLTGGLGNDTYVVDSMRDMVIENPNEGTDGVQSGISYTLSANVENLTLTGIAAIDGTGNALANTINGNSAANVLDGGAGSDSLSGGLGNDTYMFGRGYGLDVVVENDSTTGNIDTVQLLAGIDQTDIVVSRYASSLYLKIAGTSDQMKLSNWFVTDGCKVERVRFFEGATWDVAVLIAKSNIGTTGSDYLVGTAGADTLIGGAGNDTYVVDNVADVVIENSNEGTDSVESNFSYTLSTNFENLTLTGTAAIDATGNASGNTLNGNSGANVLDGGAGSDSLAGGLGNDTYMFGRGYRLDVVVENDATIGNIDTVQLAAGISQADVLVAGDASGNLTIKIAGTADQIMLSNWFSDDSCKVEQVRFADGVIWNIAALVSKSNLGTTGNDYFRGAAGADTMIGGAGADTYVVDNLGDVVIENPSEGNDEVNSSVSYGLSANVENLTLIGTAAINGTGNVLNNVLTGNSAANILAGGLGNDTYTVDNVGDVVVENLGEGTDTVQSSIGYALPAYVENLILTGGAAINGTGNDADNLMTGNIGANTLAGGAGNDTYIADRDDVVIENASEGTDTVQSSLSYSLSANVENLILTGISPIAGTGNSARNVITGNRAANTLDGGTAADTLIGGIGSDTYIVDDVGDVVVENPSEGRDTVQSNVSYTLGSNVEDLILSTGSAINGAGNALGNTIEGNWIANVLDGGAGDDVLIGNAGNDTYMFGRGYGSDTVRDFLGNFDAAQFLDGIAAEQLWFRHVGNNLEASIIGTTDKLTVENWYLGDQLHIEQFKTANGMWLLDSQVENLVQAMAAFAPPSAGQTTLPPAYQEVLTPVIAANWQ